MKQANTQFPESSVNFWSHNQTATNIYLC